jgi:hypothetical protein
VLDILSTTNRIYRNENPPDDIVIEGHGGFIIIEEARFTSYEDSDRGTYELLREGSLLGHY